MAAGGLASLAGYGSDSDDEGSAVQAQQQQSPEAGPSRPSQSSSLISSLPPPRASTSQGLSLPVPSNTNKVNSKLSLPQPSRPNTSTSAPQKRKIQIKVDSISSPHDDDDEDVANASSSSGRDRQPDAKRPKSLSSGSTSTHSLLGMLPAPKRKDEEVRAERKQEADARRAAKLNEDEDEEQNLVVGQAPLQLVCPPDVEEADDHEDGVEEPSVKPNKGKSNDAFRAMLGLKPTAKPAVIPPRSDSSKSNRAPASAPTLVPTSVKAKPNSTEIELPIPKSQHNSNSATGVETQEVKPKSQNDFFSLDETRSQGTGRNGSLTSSSFRISAAPTVDASTHNDAYTSDDAAKKEEKDAYAGWQLDPDGSWVPVTPETQAQYRAWQQQQQEQQSSLATSSPSSNHKSGSRLDDGTKDLQSFGLRPEDIQSFDASSVARDAYEASRLKDGSGDDDTEKYALAAEFAAGNRDVSINKKPGNLKGLRKGQLSSLVNLATENRNKLEQKWQRGREARHRSGNQYGF